MKNKIQLSIIIVNYKVEKEIITCVSSIFKFAPKVPFEIIVVDNDSKNMLEDLLRNISQVRYVRSGNNIGFGAGNNLGVTHSKGDFLFFLNPDTLIKKDSIDILFNFIKNNPKAGMVAPLLFDPSGQAYPHQGSDKYDFVNAIVTSSFVNKLFPNNPVSSKFFHRNWDKKTIEEFDVVPGTAFVISKDLFKKVGVFDEKIFLYFEEYDLAKRIKNLGYKNYIIPESKIIHAWGVSTKKRKDIGKIFDENRYMFFKKHYGTLFALMIKIISNFGKYELLLSLILCISAFLGLYKIRELMTFIGDQGWFYLSARDMLVNGQIPLVGIASSHPWLHQGPLWTYLLAFALWSFRFDPVSGAYITVVLGLLSIIGIYLVGSRLFSKRAGLIASLLYATSPLAVYYMRFPYHTSPIPLFILILIFPLYKIIQGKFNFLPLAIFLLVILYNLEIAAATLWGALAAMLIFIYFKNKENFKRILDKKILIFSFFSLMIPLLPMILYDVRNGFPQTLKFSIWILYKTVSLFGYNQQQAFSINKISAMFYFLFINFTKLIFAQSGLISFVILLFLAGWIIYAFLKKKTVTSFNLTILLMVIPLIIIILNQVPSDAYLPMFFPIIILLLSSFLDFLLTKKILFVPIIILVMFLVGGNINFMLKNNFEFDESSKLFILSQRLEASNQVLNLTQNKSYNFIGKGPGSEFESFTMNYKYLTWWLGHGPSGKNESLKIYISESANGIKIESKNLKHD